MRLVLLNDKQIGKRLALPIYTQIGNIFIREGYEISSFVLKKLRNINIMSAYIVDDDPDAKSLQETLETPIKLEIISGMRQCYEQIAKSKVIDEKLVRVQVEKLLKHVNLGDNTIMSNNFVRDDQYAKMILHSLDVAVCSMRIGVARKYSTRKMEEIVASSLLHDIGKLVTDHHQHMKVAYELLKQNRGIPATVFVPILHLHERIDGKGPLKVPGDKLYENSQVLHLANHYINMKDKGILPHEIIERLTCESVQKFNPEVFSDSIKGLECYSNGLPIRLNTGEMGIVIRQNLGIPTRPIIKTEEVLKPRIVDLNQELSVFITQIEWAM